MCSWMKMGVAWEIVDDDSRRSSPGTGCGMALKAMTINIGRMRLVKGEDLASLECF